MALGFYLLLIASLAAYLAAFYFLILAVPVLFQHPNIATIKVGVPALLALFGALIVFFIATVRGIFVRTGGSITGIQAHRGYHQSVFTLVREVAEKVGAKPLDHIVITPDDNIGVREEAALYLPPGFGKRHLVLGMGALCYLTVDQLRAILAHEFGHFAGKDTFFSRFIYRVHMGFDQAVASMMEVRFWWLNPALWIIGLYTYLYKLVAASLSRLREFWADRFAVEAYGKDLFGQALIVAHLEGSFFGEVGMLEIFEAIQSRRRHENIYHHVGVLRRSYERQNPGYIRKILGSIMMEKAHGMSSHPSLGDRLRKMNVATALIQLPPLPRVMTTQTLVQTVPQDLYESVVNGPSSAAEELFGANALAMQRDLTNMSSDRLIFMIQEAKARRAAALDSA